MGDNPFSPEGNPFLQGDGGPTGGGPISTGDGAPTQGPAAVPETTKPRQMPGGASPTGMPPMGMPGAPMPTGEGVTTPAPAPAPMPFTDPAAASGQGQNMQPPAGGNTPQPTPPTQVASFKRAVAMRDEILVHNPHLTAPQAFYLAKAALGLQVMARQPTYDPNNFNDDRNPASPKHPNYNNRARNQGGAPQWNPQGPTLGPNSGYGDQDPSWAQRARQIGYSGQSPALVGGAVTLVDMLWRKHKQRQEGDGPDEQDGQDEPRSPRAVPDPQHGRHEAPTDDMPDNSAQRGRHEAPQRGRHERAPMGSDQENSVPQPNQGAVTTPVPGAAHTQPGGPPTPHLHPDAPQPGEPSVPNLRQRVKQRASDAVEDYLRPKPVDLNEHDQPRQARRRSGYTATLVYGEA